MRHFIFVTNEGFTTTPLDMDIENLQVLGIASGIDEKEAFVTFIRENPHLEDSGFEDTVAMELKNQIEFAFSLRTSQ
jgi:hypothetical protein